MFSCFGHFLVQRYITEKKGYIDHHGTDPALSPFGCPTASGAGSVLQEEPPLVVSLLLNKCGRKQSGQKAQRWTAVSHGDLHGHLVTKGDGQ